MINTKMLAVLMVSLMMVVSLAPLMEDVDATYSEDSTIYTNGNNNQSQAGISNNVIIPEPTQIYAEYGEIINIVDYVPTSGTHNVMFLTSDGKLYGKGYNYYGVFGTGDTNNVTEIMQIGSGLGTIVDFNANIQNTYILTSDGKLYGVGTNGYGQLGTGNTTAQTSFVQIGSGLGTINSFSFNNIGSPYGYSLIFTTSSGNIYGTGYSVNNLYGTNGNVTTPYLIGNVQNISEYWLCFNSQNAGGSAGTLFVHTSDGKLYGVGSNVYGQIGDGTTTEATSLTQIGSSIGNISKVLPVWGNQGQCSVYMITSNNELYYLGGGLGSPTGSNATTPVQVGASLGSIVDVYSYPDYRGNTAIFRLSDGNYYGFGDNYYGQLGTGNRTAVRTPVQVGANLGSIVQLERYYLNTKLITSDGDIYTTGGSGNNPQTTFVKINTESDVSFTEMIDSNLFKSSTGDYYATGSNTYHQISPSQTSNYTSPTKIGIGIENIMKIQQGNTYYYYTSDGKLYGVGNNENGILGIELVNRIDGYEPIDLDPTTISKIYPFGGSTVFLTNDGKAYACGYDYSGVYGLGDTNRKTVYPPAQIYADCGTIVDVKASSLASDNSTTYGNLGCLNSDGDLFVTGYNYYGNLGTGNTNSASTPFKINEGYGSVIKFDITTQNTFFVTSDGKLYGVGNGEYGQLGNGQSGSSNKVSTPIQIGADIGTIVDVKCDGVTTYVLTSDGKLFGFGYNNYGQIGDGTQTNVLIPTQVGTVSNVSKIYSIDNTLFIITSDGKLYGVGHNRQGILGNGGYSVVTTPIQIGADVGTIVDITGDTYNVLILTSDGKLYRTGQPESGNDTTITQTGEEYGTFEKCYNNLFVQASDGKVYGMGGNTFGQITGTPSSTRVKSLTQIEPELGVINDVFRYSTTQTYLVVSPFVADATITNPTPDYGTVTETSITDIVKGTEITLSNDGDDYTITFGTYGSSTATPETDTAQYTYEFVGWYANDTLIQDGDIFNDAMSIEARFTQTLNSYTITWVIGETSTTETYDYGEMPTHENPTPPEGYYFAGWNPEIATVTADQTYTAVFMENIVVTFDVGKGTMGGESTRIVERGEPLGELPSVTPPLNYTFEGWYTADGTEVTADTIVTEYVSFTLYAHYELVPALQPVKAILDILPILMAVGLILGAVYVFITRPELATGNNLLYAIVGISVAVLMMAVFVIPIIGSAL